MPFKSMATSGISFQAEFLHSLLLVLLLLLAITASGALAGCPVGMNYAVNYNDGNALSIQKSVQRLLAMGVRSIKLYDANPDVLNQLKGSGVEVVVGTYPNDITTKWAQDPASADQWLQDNILPFLGSVNIKTIAVANELVDTGTSDESKWNYVAGGMWALYKALESRGLQDKIKVTTPQHPGFICNGKPPSQAYELPQLTQAFKDVLNFVTSTGSFLYLTIFPWYPYIRIRGACPEEPAELSRDFIFFKGDGYTDPGTGLYYQNQFDAQLDAVLAVAAKLGYPNVDVQLAETGWPTGGYQGASIADAQEWMQAAVGHLCSGKGTPLRPGKFIPFWLFEGFDEPWKGNPTSPWEPHWGVNYIDGTQKYALDLWNAGKYSATPALDPASPSYCFPKKGANATAVETEVDFICSEGGVDCQAATSLCPSKLHAAVVYNAYYQLKNQASEACDMSGTGQIRRRLPLNLLKKHPSCTLQGKSSADTGL